MTQDVASKGLGVVYENCSPEQKKELVSILVDTLTTGKTLLCSQTVCYVAVTVKESSHKYEHKMKLLILLKLKSFGTHSNEYNLAFSLDIR